MPLQIRIAGRLRVALVAGLLLGAAFANSTHTVQAGDTLFDLAQRYQTSVDVLMRLNGLQSTLIQVGQVLAVTENVARSGFHTHIVAEGEDLVGLAERYGLGLWSLESANSGIASPLAPGASLVVPPGDGLTVRVQPSDTLLTIATAYGVAPSELANANGFRGPQDVVAGSLVLVPTAAPQAPVGGGPGRGDHRGRQTAVLARFSPLLAAFERGAATFIAPVEGRLSSGFGWRNISVGGNRFHAGVDIAASAGTPVRASRDGIVGRSGWIGAYGYAVFLDHGDGTQTRYAHLSSVAVEEGAVLRQGDVVGTVGSTGASTGPHLHFELRLAGRAVDPLPLLEP